MGQIHQISFINDPKCPLLDYIRQGIKTVEGRVNAVKYQNIKSGDYIVFNTSNEDPVWVEVTYINKYETLEDYLRKETIEKALPCVYTMEKAINIYNQWSTPQQRNKLLEDFGCAFLGIGIKLIDEKDIVYFSSN